MKRFALYIDGFNFYHGIKDLNKPYLKWVNLWQLADRISWDNEQVVLVKYFSAYATWLVDPMKRHESYVAALRGAGVTPVMAHFKKKTVQCRGCGDTWESREEKETDVHLALQILADAEDDKFDRAAILSADSDLVPVVRMVKARHSAKKIMVCAPPGRYARGRNLEEVADQYIEIRPAKLKQCLFGAQTDDDEGNVIERPAEYTPPAQ